MEQIVNLNNVSGNSLFIESLGWDMPTGQTYCQASGEFTTNELASALDDDFGAAITAGDIIVNDGTNDLNSVDALAWIRSASKKYIDDRDDAISQAFAAADSDIQDELDITQLAAGLATDGTYVPRTTSNYLNSATSLANEGTLLDAQIKDNADNISTLGNALTDGLDLKVDRAGDTMTGDLNMGTNEVFSVSLPSSQNSYVNKAWVEMMMNGVAPKAQAEAATNQPLPTCTYDNGVAGVGATLTSDSTGTINPFDGITLVVGDSLVIAGQLNAFENGVYEVSVVGGPGVAWELIRRADTDGSPAAECYPGSTIPVFSGDTWAGYMFYILGESGVAKVMGTDSIDFGWTPNSTATANVQAEIDAIESALNLNTDGTFKAHVGTNYIDAAITSFEARELLDDQVKLNEDAISSNTTEIANILGTLINIATYDGAVYAKDVTRNLWLGPREVYIYGRKGNVRYKYLKVADGIYGNNSSIRIERDMAITSLTANFKHANTGTTNIQIRINGTPVAAGSFLNVISAAGETRTDLNIALVADDIVSVYCAGSTCKEPVVKLTAAYSVSL